MITLLQLFEDSRHKGVSFAFVCLFVCSLALVIYYCLKSSDSNLLFCLKTGPLERQGKLKNDVISLLFRACTQREQLSE